MPGALLGLVPDATTGLWAGGAGLLLGVALAAGAGALRERGMQVAYTRKIFHFGIFTGAGAVHVVGGLPATNAYGVVVALLVVGAVIRGDGHPFYEALARDKDRPRRSLFIVVPLLTTALGGLASALLAGPWAVVGYLVAGWGDAVGEPVGARWGRHAYRVPSLAGVEAHRTWEGSAAVLVVGAGAAALAMAGVGVPAGSLIFPALAVGGVAAAVEAVSSHGTDNFTVQLAASLTALALLG